MSLPPSGEIPQGAIRFNTDSQKLEFYAQGEWWVMSTDTPNLGQATDSTPGPRGLIGSGSPATTAIDMINISSTGSATSFGTLLYGAAYRGGLSSSTRGIFINGQNDQSVDMVTIASQGDAVTFGEITNDNMGGATYSNSTRGYRAGGNDAGIPSTQIIGMTIASTGSFFDFGTLTASMTYVNGCGSPTRAITFGGVSPGVSYHGTIQTHNMSSTGQTQVWGELNTDRKYNAAHSNAIRAYTGMGEGPGSTGLSSMEYINIASGGNAVDFGDTNGASGNVGSGNCASPTRGIFAGGNTPGFCDYHNLVTLGDTVTFATLNYHAQYNGQLSNAHGGL